MMDRNSFNVGGVALPPTVLRRDMPCRDRSREDLGRDKNRRAERASHIGGTQDGQNKDNPNNTLVPTVAKRSGGTV